MMKKYGNLLNNHIIKRILFIYLIIAFRKFINYKMNELEIFTLIYFWKLRRMQNTIKFC